MPRHQKARAYPHDLNAERALIASALISNTSINLVRDQIDDVDFYMERHRLIWGRIVALSDNDSAVDPITLASTLGDDLAQVGGMAYLSDLLAAAPTADHAEDYAAIVKEKAIRRRLIQAGVEIQEKALEHCEDVGALVESAEASILSVAQLRKSTTCQPISAIVKRSFERFEYLWDQKTDITGISTGFIHLDRMLAGLQKTDLLILAARPSMGKTAFALNMLAHAAIRQDMTCLFFSLEMGAEQLGTRLLTAEARVDATRIRKGDIEENDWRRIAKAGDTIYNAPIFIDDQAGLTVSALRARCRRIHAEHGLDLIMIDYLQLMDGSGKEKSREQEISKISRSLKALAKELNCPVVALSQLNRSLESRADKRPMMSDLRESGAIEQDADVIMFIYREVVYGQLDGEGHSVDPRKAEIIVAKQRNGPIGTVELAFVGEFTRFENVVVL